MAQLKEIKSRIQSVKSTQKITSAMMMISSARLVKAQRLVQNLFPYEQRLYRILQLLSTGEEEEDIDSPFLQTRTVKRVAIVAFSSNTGLAGRFNDDIGEELKKAVANYISLGKENILLYPIGEKVMKVVRNMGFEPQGDYSGIRETPSYPNAQKIAGELMEMYRKKEIDRVELIYHHFLTKGRQVVVNESFLPIELIIPDGEKYVPNYIVEPDRKTILSQLIPKILKVKFYTAHIDSVTSEHAARMTAMRIATDNADDLTEELTKQYNKLRQQSITDELLDLVGGSFDNAGG